MSQTKIEDQFHEMLLYLKQSKTLDAGQLTVILDHDTYLRNKNINTQKELRTKLQRKILAAQRRNDELHKKMDHKQGNLARAMSRITEHATKIEELHKEITERKAISTSRMDRVRESEVEIIELRRKLSIAETPMIFSDKETENMIKQLNDQIREVEETAAVEASALDAAGKETERMLQERVNHFKAELKMRNGMISKREGSLIDQQRKHDDQINGLSLNLSRKDTQIMQMARDMDALREDMKIATRPWHSRAREKAASVIFSDKKLFRWPWEWPGFWGK